MAAMHHACKNLSNEIINNMYYFNKAVALFSNSTKGIYHTGGLLSQHILVIGAAAETKTRSGIQQCFNPFQED
eukprot:12940525-Ditylum_brightwellii.AAC.1